MNKEQKPEKSNLAARIQPLVARWMAAFESAIKTENYPVGRSLFSLNVIGFGTTAIRADGLDSLMDNQWKTRWPTNQNFHFLPDTAKMLWSNDWLTTILTVEWECDARRGRATMILQAYPEQDKLLCTHSHFSENPVNRTIVVV